MELPQDVLDDKGPLVFVGQVLLVAVAHPVERLYVVVGDQVVSDQRVMLLREDFDPRLEALEGADGNVHVIV